MYKTSMLKTLIATTLALIAFAANSVLARLALENAAIDPSSFTILRLFSGSFMLFILIFIIRPKLPNNPVRKHHNMSLYQLAMRHDSQVKGSWLSGLMLFLYAICFSYAYLVLDTATGALILFGAVQITMIVSSLFSGNHIDKHEWAGLVLAFLGFVYLVLPNIGTPSFYGFVLMAFAGIGWGVYSVRGRKSVEPLTDTAFNFLRALSFSGFVFILSLSELNITINGFYYAVLSGAITSGIGYAIWYMALKRLTLTTAAVVQLSVPIIAGVGGVIFVSETISLRLLIAGLFILGGIALVIFGGKFVRTKQNET